MMSSIGFLSRFIFREKRFFFVGIFLTAIVSFLTWVGPKIIAVIIDRGLIPGDHKLTLYWVGLLAASEFLRLATVFFSQVSFAKLGQNVIERVRQTMISHLLRLPVSYFDQVTSGSMMTRIVNDVNSLTDFFQSGFVSVLGNFVSVLAIFIGIFSLNLKLGFYLTLVFIPIALLCVYFSSRLRGVYEETRNRLSELNSKLADFLFGMRTVRALGLGSRKHNELNKNVQAYANSQTKMIGTFALFQPVLSLGTGVMLFILIAYGIPLVSHGVMQVGQWAAALSYVMILQQPLVEISDRWNFFLAGITSIDRIREVFAETEETSGLISAEPIETIKFKNVNFRYEGSQEFALRDVNMVLSKGDWIGVYGESGSGKSTFLQMLYGFYSPDSGHLTWNDLNYAECKLSSLRSYFGVVEQFPFLFHGTVRENINLFGRFSFSEIKLRETFQGYTLIESLLQMLDFEISERGENLSMGQKQMITFLRAYLAKPKIWVLDEATAFFDHEAETEVLRALENLAQNEITVIQVAHRPEALVRMKRMVKVDRGILTEEKQASSNYGNIEA
jgi:ATP-binding cassette subfamily B multidrug efflux pump